ncbi:hypothetical protein BJ741DRAFT_593698 [Chytriomyces cf. hyalinus JEL632]|nr:hypothetical protein BJ741DRAFT_593698 [Chytriomyces cf. hyalinus JEL632]
MSTTHSATGSLLWRSGFMLSDVLVIVHECMATGSDAESASVTASSNDTPTPTPNPVSLLPLHAVVLRASSTFFNARLSPHWSDWSETSKTPRQDNPNKEKPTVTVESPVSLTASLLALELLYTNQMDLRVTTVDTAVDLVKTFNYLGAEDQMLWCCRYLSRECIRVGDVATLRKLKDAYPLSGFFSEVDGLLSSNIQMGSSEKYRLPSNSMTIDDLGVLIAKSSTKNGLKFTPFVQTELQENERLHFTESNGYALIHAFETVLMDLEMQRNALVDESYSDHQRLVDMEDSSSLDEDDESSDGDDLLNSEIAPAVTQAGGGGENIGNHLNAAAQGRTESITRQRRRQEKRNLRIANLRKKLDRKRAKRERHVALLKHEYVVRSGRLFKLFGHLNPVHKLVAFDSWISTGHELFCNTVELEEVKEAEEDLDEEHDDFSDDDDSFTDYDDFDESSDSDDVDSVLNDSIDEEDLEDADSFVLDNSQAIEDGGKAISSRKMSRASRNSEFGWETDDDAPNQRRSTVTINEFPTVSTASPTAAAVNEYSGMNTRTSPLTSILSPQSLRIQTNSNTAVLDELNLRVSETLTNENRGLSSSTSQGKPAPLFEDPAAAALNSASTTATINSIAASNPLLGSAFRSLPSMPNSNHPNFSLKTKIKTTSTMSQKSFGAASAAGSSRVTPPPPPSPNKLRPRGRLGRSGSSINGTSAAGDSLNGDFYYSAKARAVAQSRLENCLEFAFEELYGLAVAGAIDTWIKEGGTDCMKFSLNLRKELSKRKLRCQSRRSGHGSDSDSSDDDSNVSENDGNGGDPFTLRRAGSQASSSLHNLVAGTYTDDIARYAETYGLNENGYTMINIFLCLFDVLQAITERSNRRQNSMRHGENNATSKRAWYQKSYYTSSSYAGYPYEPRDADLRARDGFDLEHNEKLDASVAGMMGSIKNVQLLQFLIKTVLVDHDVGVGRRTGKAIVEGMKAVNSRMKGNVTAALD